jgi:lipopolysaccharide export system permease protein
MTVFEISRIIPRINFFRNPQPYTIYFYIFKEIIGIFGVSLLGASVVLFMGRIMRVMQLIITKGVGLIDIGKFCVFMIPYLLMFTVPMAAMIAVLLAFIRLSNDNEIMALKTSGFSVRQLLPPVIGFSLIITLGSLFLSLYITPWGNQSMRQLLIDITKQRADLGIREQVFNTDFHNLMFFVNRVPSAGAPLEGIFVSDERDQRLPNIIVAQKGRMFFDSQAQRLIFHLINGRVIRLNKELTSLHSVEFENYRIPLELFQFGVQRQKAEDEMYFRELLQTWRQQKYGTQDYNRFAIEVNRRVALPLGGLILTLMALPLGISSQIRGRSVGLIIGLISFLLYYILLTASWRLGMNGALSPSWSPWLPNFFFMVLAAYFWQRAARDLPISFSLAPRSILRKISAWLRKGEKYL